MDFVLIYPPSSYSKTAYKHLPMGGLYLADALLNKGLSVTIIDKEIQDIPAAVNRLVTPETIAFGISTLSGMQLQNALTIARYLRKAFPDKPIIWGGAHVTALPVQTASSDLVDYAVWGEGEQSLPLLLDTLRSGSAIADIKGIAFKDHERVVITENSGYTPLSGVFSLPYHLFEMDRYARKLSIGVERCYPVYTSRGCPYKCRFCSNTSELWPNTVVRHHTLDHIINDIHKLVNNYNADVITFADELFISNSHRLLKICSALNNSSIKGVKYRASARVDTFRRLDESIIQTLKDTGFVGFAIGLESGSQRVLDIMAKGIAVEQIYEVDDILTKYGFYKSYNFMSCLPGETLDDVKQTLSLIVSVAKSSKYCPYPLGTLSKFLPLPNTELFDVAVKYGFVPPDNIEGWTAWDLMNNSRGRIVRPWVSPALESYVDEANKRIAKLNSLYIGESADDKQIDVAIHQLNDLIDQ